jgi:hypothetical protein
MKKLPQLVASALLGVGLILTSVVQVGAQATPPLVNPNDQGIGMTGTLIQPPPSDAPTISLPSNGTIFEEIPISVTGLCTDQLLIRVFRNGVFSGSAICDGGSYEIQIDLFPGANELVARQYDDLDQGSPESNKVNVTYAIDEPLVPGSPDAVAQRITLTTNFARRGTNPGEELVWPITISGGTGPYAVSIEWGDGDTQLLTQTTAGTFDLKHTYDRPGVYRILIRATDAKGETAFLQVVGIANGNIGTAGEELNEGPTVTRTRVLWQPALITLPLLATSFWLGKRYQLKKVRYRMKHRILPIDK